MYHKASPISQPQSDDSSQVQSQKKQQETHSKTDPMLQLHQAIGNQAMGKLIQAKSEIIPPNHPSEREADKVAKSVTQFLNQHSSTQVTPSVETDLEAMATDDQFSHPQPIQRKSTNLGALGNTDIGKGIKYAQGKGKPLNENIKAPMEQALGTDFSGVRIHDNPQGNNLSSSIQAQAFTTGQDIFFKQGFYQPNSTSGKELLAHELTHVVQQQGQPLIQRKLLDQNQTEIGNKRTLWELLTGTQDISGSFSENSSVIDYIWQRGKDKDYNWQEITGTLLPNARGEFPQSTYLTFDDVDYESDDSFWDSDPLLNETVKKNSTTELQEETVVSNNTSMPVSPPQLLHTQSESEEKRKESDNELKTPEEIQSMDMGGFYDYQKTLQEDAYQEGNGNKYRHQVITVGYEFEFAQIDQNSPLNGLDHFEVAEAKKEGSKIPLEKIGFTLETDAGSELEMVTPPFLIQTASGLDKPIPDPDVVDTVQSNITNELKGIVNSHYSSSPTLTIADFAEEFKTNTGIEFKFENQQIKPEHLAGGATKTSGTITAEELKAIAIGKSWKHGSGKIDAQVNFASDAEFYNLIQDMDYDPTEILGQGLMGEIVDFYKQLTKYFSDSFLKQFKSVTSKAPDYKMTRFLKEIANIFANQTGVISQEKWLKGQKNVNSNFSSTTITTIGEGKYSVYENMMSLVKDQYPVWRKDTLMNYGLGMFEEDEWQQWNDLLTFLADKNNNNYWSNTYQESLQKINTIADSSISDKTLKDRIKKMAKEGRFSNAEYKEYYDSVRSQLKKQIRANKLHLPKVIGTTMRQKDYQDMDLSPQQRGELYHHDKQWLTPRQDTLIRGSHVQMPEIWDDKRLHVLEIRRDNSMLRKAVEKMREMEEKV